MTKTWQLQEAKNKLSQVVDEAVNRGPQIITKRGVEVAIILSYSEYRKITASKSKLSEFLRQSPLADAELDLNRDTGDIRSGIKL